MMPSTSAWADGLPVPTGDGSQILHADGTWKTPTSGGGLPTPIDIVLLDPASTRTYTNMTATDTETSVNYRLKVDLTKATDVRVMHSVRTVGNTGSRHVVQWATTEAGPWTDLCEVPMHPAGIQVGAWVPVAAVAKADVFIRCVARGGDGVVDPIVSTIHLQVR